MGCVEPDNPEILAARLIAEIAVPLYQVGQVLTRDYKGKSIVVQILPSGVEWEGQVYRSLTAAVQAITGQHWNGRHFFGLSKPRRNGR